MHEHLDELAYKFFKLFAQYESTLKERNFFRTDRTGKVIVDWDRFANEVVGTNFRTDLGEFAAYAEYILDQPPKKQVVDNCNRIVWADVANQDQSAQALFGHICRTRNNLFHGAKFNGSWFDQERSYELLKKSLAILEYYRPRLGIDSQGTNGN